MLLDRRVDGIILVGGKWQSRCCKRSPPSLPLIVVARAKTMPHHCLFVDAFRPPDITLFASMGHRILPTLRPQLSIALRWTTFSGVMRGYRRACLMWAWNLTRLLVEGTLQQQSGVLAVEMLMSRGRPFSAIFATNDQMSFRVRLALYRRGIRVPEDVSLVGFDDESSAAYMVPH